MHILISHPEVANWQSVGHTRMFGLHKDFYYYFTILGTLM